MTRRRGVSAPPLSALLLLLLSLTLLTQLCGIEGSGTGTGTCALTSVTDGFDGELTETAGDFNPGTVTYAECSAACGRVGATLSAIETITTEPTGSFACLCGDTNPPSGGTCDTCGDSSCGGLDGNVWVSPAGVDISQLQITLSTTDPVPTGTELTVTVQADVPNTNFEVSVGDGSAPVSLVGNNAGDTTWMSSASLSVTFYSPGDFALAVSATMVGGSAVVANTSSVTVTAEVELLEVTCPLVEEPDTTYYCGAMARGTDAEMTAEYDHGDNTSPVTISSPDSRWALLGRPPSQGTSNTTEITDGHAEFLLPTPFRTPTVIVQARAFGAGSATCAINVVTPSCSDGSAFCASSGTCTPDCARVLEEVEELYQCSTGSVLCPLKGICSSSAGACSSSSSPSSFSTVGTFDLSVQDVTHTAASPSSELIAQPGDMIQVSCDAAAIAAVAADGSSSGDLDAASSAGLNVHHLVEVIGTRLMPITVAHQCQTPVQNVTFTVSLSSGTSMSNQTACEYIIRNLTITLEQDGIVKDLSQPVYLDTSKDVNVQLKMLEGAPVLMQWDYGTPDLPIDNQELNERVDPSLFYTKTVRYPEDGTFNINASATNLHSIELGATWAEQEVILQHPVLADWTVHIITETILVEPTADPPVPAQVVFHLKLPSTLLLPTDALIFAHYGDDYPMPEFEPVLIHGISDNSTATDGYYVLELTHMYAEEGIYPVVIDMKNEVSNLTLETEVEVHEKIIDLQVQIKFQLREETAELEMGLGDDYNEFHNDKNLSFVMSMTQGTVTEYAMFNSSNGEEMLIHTFIPTDPFEPAADDFVYHFDENQNLNLTFQPKNLYETSELVTASIFIKDPVTPIEGMQVLEGPDVTSRGMEKPINITFDAASTMFMCMVVDYGDGSPLASYGDEEVCMTNYTQSAFQPNDLTTPMELKHTYWRDGEYNLTVIIYNPVSIGTAELTFLVTQFPCSRPIMEIDGAGVTKEAAKEYYRSAKITITADTQIACDLMFNKIKKWSVMKIDESTGETLEIVEIENILPSWNKSSLFFKSKYLDFGLYKLQYAITLWEEGTEKPELPYTVVSVCYINVIRSPLIPIMVLGSVSRVVRGWGQKMTLDPAMQSIDPDLPDDKNFQVEWFCRLVTENFTMNGTELVREPKQPVPLPTDPPPSTNDGGCFGLGPGPVDYHQGVWEIDTNIFHPRGQEVTFELMAFIMKEGRVADVFIHLEMVSGRPPMMEIVCADPLLCSPTLGGVFVNPSVRLALRGQCTFDCFLPLTYKWKVSIIENDEPVPIEGVEDFIMSAPGTKELALSAHLFGNFSNVEKFHVSLTSNNSHPSQKTGSSTIYVVINKPPIVKNSNCRTTTTGNTALLDKMVVSCQMPVDPEEHPIRKFEFRTKTVSPTTGQERWKTVITVKKPEISLRMPFGEVSVYYDVSDILNGVTTKHVTTFSTQLPTQNQYNDFMNGQPFREASSSGNVKELAMIMQASETIRESADWLRKDYIPEGMDASDMAATISDQNAAAMNGLSNLAMEGKGSLDMAASTMESVLGTSMGSPENSLQVDSETLSASLGVVDAMIDGLGEAEIASPEGLVKAYAGISSVVGLATVNAATIAADENCTAMPAADLKRAGTLEYDGLIGDYDGETVIPEKDKQLACNVRTINMVTAGGNSGRFDRTVESMQRNALNKQVLGEELVVKSPSGMTLTTKMMENMTATALAAGDDGGGIETGDNFCPTGNCEDPIAVALTDYPTNAKSSATGAEALSKEARVISMEVKSRDLNDVEVSNLTQPLVITIPKTVKNMSLPGMDNCTDCVPGPSLINTTAALKNKLVPLIYSQFSIPKPDSAFNIEVYPLNDNAHRLFVLVSIGRQPTLKNHEFFRMVSDFPKRIAPPDNSVEADAKYDWFLNSDIVRNRTGRAFVAVGELKDSLDLEAAKSKLDTNQTVEGAKAKDYLKTVLDTDYLIRTYVSGCYYYKKDWDIWTSDGLKCIEATDAYVKCESSHLTMFGSGFVPEPNTIDFAYVFANASFTDNLTIYMTMIISLTLYFILVIWARWQDKKDAEKLGARPLPDNVPEDKYLYEVMVFTGHKSSAATDSTVSMIISGDKAETKMRTFGEPKRKFFRKGGQDVFVMATPRPLGDLQYLRIWHDNTGRGRYASWYLQYILIRDVQTGKNYTFVGDRWLALEEDDGSIDRLIAVAGKEQMSEFSHLFAHTSQQNLSDGHLWFSVFLRPPRSRFTRVQRVSSCFALLFLSMMVNAMWYGVVPSKPSTGISIGPMTLSSEQIAVAFMSNLIVFFPSFVIVFLFRKARPRTLRKSRIDEALEKQSFGNHLANSERPGSSESRRGDDDDEDRRKKGKKKKFTLPWWCNIIAWILCVLCLFGSAFIVWSYGVQFGNEKTTKWLTSLLMSFFSSILLIQPIKVFLLATLISAIFKNVDLDSDDADEDEKDPTLADDEEWMYKKPPRGSKAKYWNGQREMYDPDTLEKMRKGRKNEVQMWRVIREIASYGFFLYILVILSFDNRDPNSFFLRANLEAAFIKEGDLTAWKNDLDFSKVHDTGTFWTWAQNVIMAELRAQNWYDNVSPPYGLRGFLDDRVNRIMGYGMIRQIRTQPNTCHIHRSFSDQISSCAGLSAIRHEEEGHFCAGWNKTGTAKECSRPEYKYQTATQLQGLPHVGDIDYYGGGGYVFRLTGRMSTIAKRMKELQQELWIDHLTRAVLVEFSVYNAQVNLFGIATIFVEAVPGGGFLPNWRFDGVRLIRHHIGFQLFVFVCEVTYMLFIIYFMIREIRDICKLKKRYMDSYWVYAEWAVIILSWTALIIYILRYIETAEVLETFKKTYGNGYIRMQYAQTLDDMFGYLMGMLVFVATIKFSKLLRFNRRIGMLSATLKQCWGDLAGFFAIFFIALGSFAMTFNLLLVTHMSDFKNMLSGSESAFAMMLNKFDFETMYRSSILAVCLFLAFAVIMTIFFVNVLLTIIIRAFQLVKEDVFGKPNDFEILEFMTSRVLRFIGIGRGARKVVPLRLQMKEFQEQQRLQKQKGEKVEELPDKMNQFLNQINDIYFDGSLKLNNKDFLMQILEDQQEREAAKKFKYQGGSAKKRKPRRNNNDRSNMTNALAELDDV